VEPGPASFARVWDIATGQLRFATSTNQEAIGIAFSPDGKYLLTTRDDTTAQLWEIQGKRRVRDFRGHTGIIWSVAFSPDGKSIATASADGTARLWDAQTGKELRRLIGHTAGVENVTFSPDGKYLLTGSDDGTAMLWDIDYHTTINYLCSVLQRDFKDQERAQYNIKDGTPTCPS
jgi:WD40 repeat protein